MHKELELWRFVSERLARGERVMLLVVAESSGSSPGRHGYKLAVGADGELIGSIGGGVMEVNLVEQSRGILSEASNVSDSAFHIPHSEFVEQVHRKDARNASGMICSGKQTVIFRLLTGRDAEAVRSVLEAISSRQLNRLIISPTEFRIERAGFENPSNPKSKTQNPKSHEFLYTETLGFTDHLYIIGGGHCALALSELMSRMDFHITIFDDRPDLNTIAKNKFAHEIKIVDSYELISDHISSGRSAYVVVMTLGYKTDETVIRGLIDKEFKYFGVLGSKAKMSTMFKSLRNDGISDDILGRIRTPIGLPINSRTPDEIAVSIAAEIISVKNG